MTVAAQPLPKSMEQAGRPEAGGPTVLLLSTDPALRAVLRTAIDESLTYRQVDSADEAVDLLMQGRCGVLIADLSLVRGELFASLREQFPDLALIAAGTREEEAEVTRLVSDGTLFRFLHKPASPGRAKLFVDAGIGRHRGATGSGPLRRSGGRRSGGLWVAAGLLAVLAAALLAWWTLRAPQPPAASGPVAEPRATTAEQEAVAEVLARARTAVREQRLIPPSQENALDLYLDVLGRNPDEPEALDGLRRVIDALLGQAESALTDQDLETTRRMLAQVRRAKPEHPRLNFLEAQVARAEAAEAARIAALTAAESAEAVEIRRLLGLADQRIAQGRLMENGGNDARAYVLRALTLDRANPEVRSVAALTGAGLVERGETALEAGELDAAQRWARGAAEFAEASGAEFRGLPALTSRIDDALAERSRNRIADHLDLADRRLDQENWIAPAGDSARDHLIAARTLGADPQDVAPLERRLLDGLIGAARTAIQGLDLDAAQALLDAADRLAPEDDTVAEMTATLATARARQAFFEAVVPANSLVVVRNAAPNYPRDAIRRGIEGFVELHFTVARDGSTREFEVVASQPEGVFEEAAVEALDKWRFEPVIRDGEAVEQRASARLKFQLER
jgi:TonB family protein